jgi:hypothetical protein
MLKSENTPPRKRLRRGFLAELKDVFEAAEEMQGGGGDPDTMAERKAAIRALHREVLRELKNR